MVAKVVKSHEYGIMASLSRCVTVDPGVYTSVLILSTAYSGHGSTIVIFTVYGVVMNELTPLEASNVTMYSPGAKPGFDASRGKTSSSVV